MACQWRGWGEAHQCRQLGTVPASPSHPTLILLGCISAQLPAYGAGCAATGEMQTASALSSFPKLQYGRSCHFCPPPPGCSVDTAFRQSFQLSPHCNWEVEWWGGSGVKQQQHRHRLQLPSLDTVPMGWKMRPHATKKLGAGNLEVATAQLRAKLCRPMGRICPTGCMLMTPALGKGRYLS